MAEFLALRIINGKLEYNKVPATLKEQVDDVLKRMGHEELIEVQEEKETESIEINNETVSEVNQNDANNNE
ncbi:MAG: hypothetical protein ACLRT4_13640 [Thomasclavelia sp.]